MSLINDALRKAGKTQKSRAPQQPLGVPIQAADSLKRPSGAVGGLMGSIVVLTILGVSVWAFAVWWKAKNTPPATLASALSPADGSSGSTPLEAMPEPVSRPPANQEGDAGNAAIASSPTPRQAAVPVAPPSGRQALAPTDSVSPQAPTREAETAVAAREERSVNADVAASARTVTQPRPDPVPKVATPSPSAQPQAPAAKLASIPYSVPTPSVKSTEPGGSGEAAGRATDFVKLKPSTPPSQSSTGDSFPDLNLQGIFFRLKNPSVMINRRALYVGDDIAGVTVVEIQRRTVTVEKDGNRKVLSMGGY